MSTPIGSSQWMYATGAEVTQQSLKFNDDESQYLSWTPAAAGNLTTWTWSGWVKRANLGGTQAIFSTATTNDVIYFDASNSLTFYTTGNYYSIPPNVFRDTSAWYHFVFVWDTNNATQADRIRIYVNGERLAFGSGTQAASGATSGFNNNVVHGIGYAPYVNSYFLDGYLSDINFIDGQALDPTSFGQFTNGYWEKKDYAGTYGTNGFHLTFQDDVVSEGFNTVTYRGTGATQSISGLGFSPDLVWAKSRSAASSHRIADAIRGTELILYSDTTDAEGTEANALDSFDADGFTAGSGGSMNVNGVTHVAWAWDAGSGSPVSNTDGSITSTVKANPSYGFSITSFVGTGANATVGHGLSSAPDIVILKNRSIVSSWLVRTQVLAANQTLLLENTTTPIGTDYWQNTQPDSSVFSVSSNSEANGSGNNLIAYCFAEVAGYSSIGSYSGTGAAGNAVTGLGFKPAWIMIKDSTNSGNSWVILDNTRDTTDPRESGLFPDGSYAESDLATGYISSFDADGFTVAGSGGAINTSGATMIYMAFADTREAAFWKDVSGQGNHWTPNNLDYRDSVIDSPANNFATMNSIDVPSTGTLSEGNLKVTGANYLRRKANWHFGAGGIQSGKWYWEICNVGSAYGTDNGVIGSLTEAGGENFLVANKSYFRTGDIYKNYTSTSYVSSGATYTSGDVVGFALDLDSSPQTIKYYHNGTLINTDSTISAAPVLVPFTSSTNGSWPDTYYNFGQDSTFAGNKTAGGNQDDNGVGDFAYPVPSGGYLALCTANLPTPSIVDGSTAFSTVLYTGNNSTQSITGVGFQPDWVWLKSRTTGYDHTVYDVIRGATYKLPTNDTYAESADVDTLTSFDSDGFSVGADVKVNAASGAMVSWNWKAGGTAVSNTAGSITSQVSANVDAGFSIVSYTGTGANATVGHGLSSAPDMVIVKSRSGPYAWTVYNASVGATYRLRLNETAAAALSSEFNNTTPTSTVFSVDGTLTVNGSGQSHIAYCFANTDTTKVGSYTGNGSTDGPFVYTGFRPAWVMVKRADASYDWIIWDAKRDTYNELSKFLYPNLSAAEAIGSGVADLLSNGFKLRNAGTANRNASGGTYIYLAIMESPLKHSNAR